MHHDEPTPFAELDGVLDELMKLAVEVLEADLVGVYLVGSFALGGADLHSDCDFLVVTGRPVGESEEAQLRRFHHDLPKREGHWNRHLEGSYPPIEDLRTLTTVDRDAWLYVDHGSDTMQWSTHCNNEAQRWTLRERGVTLCGPAPATFVCEIPPEVLRDRMRVEIPRFIPQLQTWIDFSSGWAQRYAVATLCRMLYSLRSGAVCSKPAALEWASGHLDTRWTALFHQVRDDRSRGLDFGDPPRPGSVDQTLEFATYATRLAATW